MTKRSDARHDGQGVRLTEDQWALVRDADAQLMARSLAREAWVDRSRQGLPLGDFMSVAEQALIEAASRFSPDDDSSFSSFARQDVRDRLSRISGPHAWLVPELEVAAPERLQAATASGELQAELTELFMGVVESYRELPAEYTALLLAHYVEGKTLLTIADEMGVHPEKVYRMREEAMSRMRGSLKTKGLIEDDSAAALG